ncbi:MAG: methyltransferase domain-containing protein [Candidatus Nanoarchaeia archaeon]|nr:methyltransferase domain-containing protein [Candidatus Nanoarchaeia archaeon]
MKEKNEIHWENLGKDYSNSWLTPSKQMMSQKESKFIAKYANLARPKYSLDIGVGNGRILENHINNNIPNIYGMDISKNMVEICLEKFKDKSNIKNIKVCDISKEKIPFQNNFDFVSAIRVLKYNKNWKEILERIISKLNKEGIFVFTMLNKKSLNIFGKYNIEYYRTDYNEITKIIKRKGMELLEIRTFTRIPDVFYDLSKSYCYGKFLMGVETFLEIFFGKIFLGRIFFIAVRKADKVTK